MNTKLLLLFILFPTFVFSQTKITGKVIDKETQKPVSDVIIHSSGKISITIDKGEFDFDINNQSEVVHFSHISYKSFKIQSDALQNNGPVYLVSNITELSEVVISPDRANYLLNKAIHNLFTNFQKEKTTAYYLTHIEEKTTKGGEREIYALFETLLDKVNAKKRLFDWDLKLMQLDRVKNMGKDDFIIGRIIKRYFSIQFFPSPFRFSYNTTKDTANIFLREIYDENSDYVIIRSYPKYPSKRNYHYFLYTINKQDTVITDIITQSYANSNELTTKKVKNSNYGIYNHFHIDKFSKDASGLYYLEQNQHFSHIKVMGDAPYEITLSALTHAVENISTDEVETMNKRRMYLPYSYYLYRSKFPDSPRFWEKYLKNE
jgi:hypothetical protein